MNRLERQERDERLRAMLRAADPAAPENGGPALRPEEIAALRRAVLGAVPTARRWNLAWAAGMAALAAAVLAVLVAAPHRPGARSHAPELEASNRASRPGTSPPRSGHVQPADSTPGVSQPAAGLPAAPALSPETFAPERHAASAARRPILPDWVETPAPRRQRSHAAPAVRRGADSRPDDGGAAPPADEMPAVQASQPENTPCQLQFRAPGGTQVIWSLEPEAATPGR